MNQRLLIIGIGSPFGDDCFGWAAAEALRHSPSLDDDSRKWIEIITLDRPGALLPLRWRSADTVLLLDAVRSGAPPGTRHRLSAHDLAGTGLLRSSHGFGVASAIRLAQALGDMPTCLLLRGLEVDPAWTGFELSSTATAALPSFVADIAQEALALAGFHPSPVAANLN